MTLVTLSEFKSLNWKNPSAYGLLIVINHQNQVLKKNQILNIKIYFNMNVFHNTIESADSTVVRRSETLEILDEKVEFHNNWKRRLHELIYNLAW